MNDWIDEAKEKEDQAARHRVEQNRLRMDQVERLRVVFPDWQNNLLDWIRAVCEKLASSFPGDLTRNYSVNLKPNGCTVRCQGFPELTLELAFDLPAQRMKIEHFQQQNLHFASKLPFANVGRINITNQSDVFITYNDTNYSNPKLLADALMKELTQPDRPVTPLQA